MWEWPRPRMSRAADRAHGLGEGFNQVNHDSSEQSNGLLLAGFLDRGGERPWPDNFSPIR